MSRCDRGRAWFKNREDSIAESPTKQMNDMESEAANQLDHLMSNPGGISSALRSVGFHMWGHGDLDLPEAQPCPAPERNTDSPASPASKVKSRRSLDFQGNISATKFKSKYIRGCPLYQDYCKTSGKGDMHMMNLSRLMTSQCLPGLRPLHSPSLDSGSLPRSIHKVAPCTLWQDLSEVRERGLLSSLGVEEIRLQESKFEMIASEASYLKSLGVVVNHFFTSHTLRLTLSKMEYHVLFSNLCVMQTASENFLKDLEVRLGEDVMISQVGDIVLRHCPEFRSLYVPYVTNMMYQETLFKTLLQENREFLLAVTNLERDSVCQRQRLKSFLVMPFQRITRLKIIMESILKLTGKNSESVSCLREAIEAVHKIVSECNEQTQTMRRIEALIHLAKLVDFHKVKSIALITTGRYLLFEGSLREPIMAGTWGSKMTFKEIYIHLFNDLLLISSKKGLRFSVRDYAAFPSHVFTEPLTEVPGLPSESFMLRLSQNHAGKAVSFALVCHPTSNLQTWMEFLSATKSTVIDP